MTGKLFLQAITKFLAGVALVGLLLFLPAGTWNYPHGWLFCGILFVPMLIAGIVLMFRNPELLRRRLEAKEKEMTQKTVILLSGLMFIVGFVLCGLSFRFGWPMLPLPACIAAAAVFLCAYALFGEVMRENAWLSRTVGVQEGQKVVDTGLYGIVRHPMYAASVLLFLSMPFVLGAVAAVPVFLVWPFLLVKRVLNEEEVLKRELPGYEDYMKRVKYRLIPFVW